MPIIRTQRSEDLDIIDLNEPSPKFTGVFIPARILRMKVLSSSDIILLSWIDALDDRKNKHKGCFASNKYLSDMMNLKENTIQVILTKLKSLGLVEQFSFDGRIRVLHSNMFKKESIESIAGVEGNQPLPMKEINPSPYIESKEEIKDIIFKMPLISLGSHVKIKQKDYDDFIVKHGKPLIDDIIERVNDYCASHGKPYKDYAAAIRTFIKNNSKPSSKATQPFKSFEEQNKDLVNKHFRNYCLYKGATCYISNESIAFERGMNHKQLKFKEFGFKEQLNNIIRSFGFSLEDIKND